MKLSIIIPALNEAKILPDLLDFLLAQPQLIEIIVVNGKSTDQTKTIAQSRPITFIESYTNHRAYQMNLGAKAATGDVFYFLHADARPPTTFYEDIRHAISKGYDLGSYRLQIGDAKPSPLAINSYFTKKNWLVFQGGGDQSMFILKDSFFQLNGFDESFVIMEDFDFIRKTRKAKLNWIVMNKSIQVSDRKYRVNHYLKVQLANLIAYSAFKYGMSPIRIKKWYNSLLVNPNKSS